MQPSVSTSSAPKRLTLQEKLALAKRLYREHYADCFWHLKPDLEITEATLALVIRGLRENGGRHEFLEAAKLAR